MRYQIQFADRTTAIVPHQDGEALIKAIASGKPAVLQGAFISPHFVSMIKPIKKGWFKPEFIEQQERAEIASPDAIKLLPVHAE